MTSNSWSFRSLVNLPGLQKCTLISRRPDSICYISDSQPWLIASAHPESFDNIWWHSQLAQLEGRDSCWFLLDTGQACFLQCSGQIPISPIAKYLAIIISTEPRLRNSVLFYFDENLSLGSRSTSAFISPWRNVPWF